MKRLNKMVATGGNKSVLYVVLFALAVFFVLYMLAKLGTRSSSSSKV